MTSFQHSDTEIGINKIRGRNPPQNLARENKMQPFQAIRTVGKANAHFREDHTYSPFHATLEYSLRHLYSLSNTQIFLNETLGWSSKETANCKHGTIDVYPNVVYIHIPRIKGFRGISRFISKKAFVDILIAKCWSKADPYKLQPASWNEFIAQGVEDFYQVSLNSQFITCTCHAFSGVGKAFNEDAGVTLYLISHPQLQGQIPDKHIFATWKYLGVANRRDYEAAYNLRLESAAALEELEF
jgi:hypothetical protein